MITVVMLVTCKGVGKGFNGEHNAYNTIEDSVVCETYLYCDSYT